jgi:hypothetical protein
MANIQEIVEFINNDEFTLEVGSNTYGGIEDLFINLDRVESKSVSNDGETTWFLGGGNNFITFTMIGTSTEILAFNALTDTASGGAYQSTAWKVVAVDLEGDNKTFNATGYLKTTGIGKGQKGYLVLTGFIRIVGDAVVTTA